VIEAWFPNDTIEHSTRQNCSYVLYKHVMPEFGGMRMVDVLSGHVREWMTKMEAGRVPVQTRQQAKVVLDAILTTAFNMFLHAGKGVKHPKVAKVPSNTSAPCSESAKQHSWP
jgi:Phage integrase, N-terminal SAM-like domain